MKAVLVAVALTLAAGASASLAQTAVPPAADPAEVATRPAGAEPVARRGEAVEERSVSDPNTTGPDKMNGLPVPQMKGETADPR